MTREKKMIKRNIHNTFAALMAAIFLVAMPVGALAKSEVNQSFLGAVAIEGTDPVAYFTEKKAVKGSSEYSLCWKGAQWGFKNAANRDLFAAQPKKIRAPIQRLLRLGGQPRLYCQHRPRGLDGSQGQALLKLQ